MTNISNTSDRNDPAIPEFIIKESVSVLGVTQDFAWYESELLLRQMSGWASQLKRLVSVMEQRSKDQNKMISDLMDENKKLKAQLKEKNERT